MENIMDWIFGNITTTCPKCKKEFKVKKQKYIKDNTYCSMNCILSKDNDCIKNNDVHTQKVQNN